MPLIIISGYPSSGKTYRAKQLQIYFAKRISKLNSSSNNSDNNNNCGDGGNDGSSDRGDTNTQSLPHSSRLRVHLVSDHDTLNLKRDAYKNARNEKDARATVYSAVKRLLGPDDLVIADGMNYIKGFRYQMYCEAKALETGCCVIHVGTSVDRCRKINNEALASKVSCDPDQRIPNHGSSEGYDEDIFDNLVYRYEEPNGMNRWDSPLFTVLHDDEHPPYEQIWNALVETDGQTKVVRPNQATVLKPPTERDYLYELDKSTSEVMSRILEWQKDHPEPGGELAMPELGTTLSLPMNKLSLPQLQRLRKQFVNMNRQHSLKKDRIKNIFVDYLNDSFGSYI